MRQFRQQIFGGAAGQSRVHHIGLGERAVINLDRAKVSVPLIADFAMPRIHLRFGDAYDTRFLQRVGDDRQSIPFLHFGSYQQRDRGGNSGPPCGVLGRCAASRAFLSCE